jgi:hypothetical protein
MKFEHCANCAVRLYENNGQRCIECQTTSYCNQVCQRAHWKFHKKVCKLSQLAKLDDLESDEKRISRWFTEWMAEGQKVILPQLFLGYFGWDTLKSMAEPGRRSVVFLQVNFNYNFRTFLLTEPPGRIIPPVGVDDVLAELMHSKYDEAEERKALFPAEKEWAVVVACVRRNGKQPGLLGIFVERNHSIARAPFESLKDNFKGVTLTPKKKFRKWTTLSNKNVSKQIKAIKKDANFTLFWGHALHMLCAEPRDSSHAIKVDLEEGLGLGEIKKLKRFRVVTKEEAMAEYEERCHGQEGFDIESARLQLDLHKSHDDTDPNAAKMAVIMFIGEAFSHIVTANVLRMPRSPGPDLTPRECDREALRAFCNLVRIQLPHVKSPELH